jgi:hypothetical protein
MVLREVGLEVVYWMRLAEAEGPVAGPYEHGNELFFCVHKRQVIS